MPIVEEIKRIFERVTGARRPKSRDVAVLVQTRKPQLYRFGDDGETPNNPRLPLIHYRGAVDLDQAYDPAAIFEVLFARNGWQGSWRDGVYDFLHFHTATHEVLGIARGRARVQFGGKAGRTLALKAGDVVILPAGTGHRRLAASKDLLVVGAYPDNAGGYDQPKPREVDHAAAKTAIRRVRRPRRDPVYGEDGPLRRLWKPTSVRIRRVRAAARSKSAT